MKSVTTYLQFDGSCRQAMQFYETSLGGELQLNPYPEATSSAARIMHAQLSRAGTPLLMASDSPEGPVKAGNNFSVSVECESVDEIERLFAAIGKSGSIRLPLGDTPWGARFGMLTDQFGIQWIFNLAQRQS